MSVPSIHPSVTARLIADLRPVRPLWSFRTRFTLWTGFGLVSFAVVVATSCRPDIAAELRDPAFVLHLAVLLAAAACTGALALRAAVPGGEPARAAIFLTGGLVAAAFLLALAVPAGAAVVSQEFVARGITCVLWTAVLALPPWLGLLVALRRGAPLAPRTAAALAGAAAVLLTAAVLRTACPIEERWHLIVWHLAPVSVAAAVSAALAAAWLRRWRTS